MPNLVGIGKSQVPTNAMLGGLAYQDPAHASLTNVDILNIAAIKASTADTALGVFVYNTANDTDGGQWRKRCQGTSWYNEGPGGSRGPRKEFPTVAVIVTTNKDLIIYDGDDPELSMWMKFPQHGYLTWPLTSNYTTHRSFALNGTIAQISNDGGSLIKFIDDYFEVIYSSTTYPLTQQRSIAARGLGSSYISASSGTNRRTYNIGVYNMRTVHMYARQDAAIDPRNGLPYPTILIGEANGNTIIKDNGSQPTIFRLSDNWGSVRPCDRGVIRSDNTLTYRNINNGTIQTRWKWDDITSGNSEQWSYNYWSNGGHNQNENITAVNHRASNDIDTNNVRDLEKNPNDPSYVYVAHSSGISMIKDGDTRGYNNNAQSIWDSKVAYITSKYNTGWLFGDIRCCVLASCVSTTEVPEATTNHVVDPGFGNTSNWAEGTGWSINGSNQAVNSGSAGYMNGTFSPALTTGKWYVMYCDFISGTIGNGGSGFGLVNHNQSNYYKPQSNTEYVDVYCTYVPMHSNHGGHKGIMVWRENSGNNANCNLYASGAAVTVDNIVVKELTEPYWGRELSNSHSTGYPIIPIGTPTREPVADGCDLQCWTDFTNTDFLVQPARDFLNYDNGNFWYSIWLYPNNSDNGDVIFSRDGVAGGNNGRFMCYFNDDRVRIDMTEYGGSSYHGMTTNQARMRQKKEWIHLVFVRSSNQLKFFVNGELDKTVTLNSTSDGTQSGNQAAGIGALFIGANSNAGQPLDKGKVALFKTGRGNNALPTYPEIKEWYADELKMFSPHTKCSVYGNSNNVVALSYDQNTDILHAGTSAGRSEFSGLVRINNTTDPITLDVSASGGVVAEE
tara:strand:- start:747 stop:3275 length:2529 start_codon:yes stop_codon:yes gene_type:complete